MESVRGSATSRNPGRQSFLPPKSPFPSIAAPVYSEYVLTGSKGAPKVREGYKNHQRTSSESFIIEEQPSWLDDLLNEPETPARRGTHRRSSSDSFAYVDGSYAYSNICNIPPGEVRRGAIDSMTSWGSQEFDQLKDAQHHYPDGNLFGRSLFNRQQDVVWESALNMENYTGGIPAINNKNIHLGPFSTATKELDTLASCVAEKQEQVEFLKDSQNGLVNDPQSESDAKRVKQQFAQRSRVRKLQYIAELERSVQVLQAEHSKFSAELEFLDQQNLILNLENKALKQRVDSLAQEHVIKCLQQETLEREIARLRSLFQQQQRPLPEVAPSHGRTSSRDLDSQLANLSIKHSVAGRDPAAGFRM